MARPQSHQRPSWKYRETLRYGLRVMATHEELECILMGKCISDLTMEELEVGYQLVFSGDPFVHAPPDYRSARW